MEVYKAINAVQKELASSGIEKSRRNQQGSGYNFRGIDDVYNAVTPLLVQHGLCIIPRVISQKTTDRTSSKGSALIYATVEVEFDFVSVVDGSTHLVRTFGEAMDSGDKATNKAMSAAYKYAAIMTFGIPTEGDNDTENTTHEVAPAIDPRITDAAMHLMGLGDDDMLTYWTELAKDRAFAGAVWKAINQETRDHINNLKGKK